MPSRRCSITLAPEKMENNNNVYIGRTSPPQVPEAYLKQFEKDFSRFLQSRSEEIVTVGHMALAFMGRGSPDPYGIHCGFLDLLSKSLIELVQEVHYFTLLTTCFLPIIR